MDFLEQIAFYLNPQCFEFQIVHCSFIHVFISIYPFIGTTQGCGQYCFYSDIPGISVGVVCLRSLAMILELG
jgi:hypothetical protein